MNYQETLKFLFAQLPMFHRIGAAAYKADLNNTIALCKMLGHPERKIRTVHIAGTNGKGSVSSMIAAIMQEAGYKTGLFTSPHLKDFRERIRINGIMIPEKVVSDFVSKYGEEFKKIQPSFFEWTAALAFDYFANEKVEVAIIETGMGGRLDSTNVILPEVSVITNIDFDHMQFLGDTLEKIAFEKAGIIKEDVPVIIGEVQEEIAHVFTSVAAERNTTCTFAPIMWRAEKLFNDTGLHEDMLPLNVFCSNELVYQNLQLDLSADYQIKNILTVLQAINVLRSKGFVISEVSIRSALKNVKALTGIRGRWEIIQRKPLVIADTAHNTAGITEVLKQIRDQTFSKLHFVIGVVNDKDVRGILDLLPKDALYYFCQANIPRALDAAELKLIASEYELNGKVFTSVADAYMEALKSCKPDDMIYIGGSTFVVAEVL